MEDWFSMTQCLYSMHRPVQGSLSGPMAVTTESRRQRRAMKMVALSIWWDVAGWKLELSRENVDYLSKGTRGIYTGKSS